MISESSSRVYSHQHNAYGYPHHGIDKYQDTDYPKGTRCKGTDDRDALLDLIAFS